MKKNKLYKQTKWVVNTKRGLTSFKSFFLRKKRVSVLEEDVFTNPIWNVRVPKTRR